MHPKLLRVTVGIVAAIGIGIGALEAASRPHGRKPGGPADTKIVEFIAPSLTEGPRLTQHGLLWSTPRTVEFMDLRGHRGSLIHASGLSTLASNSDWLATTDAHGARAGHVGSQFRAVALPPRCTPLKAASTRYGTRLASPGLYALAGDELLAAVGPECLAAHRPMGARWTIIAIHLRTGRARWVVRGAQSLLSLAAAGGRLAIQSQANADPPRVTVYNIWTRKRVYAATEPGGLSQTSPSPMQIEVDGRGDVLATGSSGGPPRPQSYGWWATGEAPTAHPLYNLLSDYRPPGSDGGLPAAAAALSSGRIAFAATNAQGRNEIDIFTIGKRTRQRLVALPPSFEILGLALAGGTVAWSQQVVISRVSSGGGCVTAPRGPVWLAYLPFNVSRLADVLPSDGSSNPSTSCLNSES